MKKILCLVIVMFLLVLSGCSSPQSNNQTREPYKFNHTGITEITGTSQMSENVKNIVIPKEKGEELLSQLEALCLKPTHNKNDTKGWQYYFVIKYDNGNIINISLSEEKVDIDGLVYTTSRYHPNDFLTYFD